MSSPLIIGVDFDGTIVEHKYPDIGKPVPGAIETLRECVALGARVVLWTMRSDTPGKDGPVLTHAVEFLRAHGVELFGVNSNPQQGDWTHSPKAYCHVYVDDAALGCPVTWREGQRASVDWVAVRPQLLKMIEQRAGAR